MDDRRLAPVKAADAVGHDRRVGDQPIDAAGATHVPALQRAEDRGQRRAGGRVQPLATGVVGGGPGEAHGAVAVADVARAGRRDDVLGEGAARRDDQVVAAQIEPREGDRIERQVRLVVAHDPRQPLHEGGADRPGAIGRGHPRAVVDRGEDRRVGPDGVELLQHPLRPPRLVEVIVDEGDARPHWQGRRGRRGGRTLLDRRAVLSGHQ